MNRYFNVGISCATAALCIINPKIAANLFQNRHAAADPSGGAHEEFQQPVFTGRQFNGG